jgi:hypothetical protein
MHVNLPNIILLNTLLPNVILLNVLLVILFSQEL